MNKMQVGVARISKLGMAIMFATACLVVMLLYKAVAPSGMTWRNPNTVCLKQLLVASIEAAERGGRVVKAVKEGSHLEVKSKGKTAEGVNDPVTLGDMLSHNAMYYSLSKMWPKMRIVSEEHPAEAPNTDDIKPIDLNTEDIEAQLASELHSDVRFEDVTVWIDPLDATKEYTENLTKYVTTMVCVAVKGEPMIGVIHKPFLKQTIWAWVGHGRSKIPNPITNIDEIHSRPTKIIVSLSHAGDVKQLAEEAFEKPEIVAAGGAGYKSLEVAKNEVDAYLHYTAIKKWDICAGNALLKQMGGKMTDLLGNGIDYFYPDSKQTGVKLKTGLLATLRDHDYILKKLRKRGDLVPGS